MKISAVVLVSALTMAGCANPAYYKHNAQFSPKRLTTIAVMPFTGDQRYTQVATDTFTLHLLGQPDFIILEPQTIQYAIDKITVGQSTPADLTVVQAKRVGEIVNADAVFVGGITSYSNGVTMNAFSTVKLVDTATGKIIAASHKPSGLLFAYSLHQGAVAAVERTANDMLKTLDNLSMKRVREISSEEETGFFPDIVPVSRLEDKTAL